MDFLKPFVLPVDVRTAERRGTLDIYPPEDPGPRPAVLVVHGGCGPSPAPIRS